MSQPHCRIEMPVDSQSVPGELPHEDRELHRLQRVAMLGTLASGLGHDLRNLVMPVLLRLDVVSASPDLPEKARSDLASIRQSILRLQRLASGLRLLASDPFDQRSEAQLTLLHEWWQDMQPIVTDALPGKTVIEVQIARDLPPVAVPPATLAQILINLVLNSRQAMGHEAAPRLWLHASVAGDCVTLDVRDNGLGMDAETRARCFEPYFTTRAREYATGLGLSTGRALLARYGGDLTLGVEEAVGTTFTITLPIRGTMAVGDRRERRRVRLLIQDPRQLAMLRLLVRHRGLVELPATEASHADLTICDPEALATIVRAGQETTRNGQGSSGDIIAIGTPPDESAEPAVRWVDPRDFSVLDDVLH